MLAGARRISKVALSQGRGLIQVRSNVLHVANFELGLKSGFCTAAPPGGAGDVAGPADGAGVGDATSVDPAVESTAPLKTSNKAMLAALKPKEVVEQLNNFIVGQADAKRAVAVGT